MCILVLCVTLAASIAAILARRRLFIVNIPIGWSRVRRSIGLTSVQRVGQVGLVAEPLGELADVSAYRLVGHAQQASGGRDVVRQGAFRPPVINAVCPAQWRQKHIKTRQIIVIVTTSTRHDGCIHFRGAHARSPSGVHENVCRHNPGGGLCVRDFFDGRRVHKTRVHSKEAVSTCLLSRGIYVLISEKNGPRWLWNLYKRVVHPPATPRTFLELSRDRDVSFSAAPLLSTRVMYNITLDNRTITTVSFSRVVHTAAVRDTLPARERNFRRSSRITRAAPSAKPSRHATYTYTRDSRIRPTGWQRPLSLRVSSGSITKRRTFCPVK